MESYSNLMKFTDNKKWIEICKWGLNELGTKHLKVMKIKHNYNYQKAMNSYNE